MIDFEKAIISSLLDCVDQVGANLVASTYQNLVHQFSPLIFSLATLFIGILFLRAMRGLVSFDECIMSTLRLVGFLTLALNYHYFCLFIYDLVTKEPLVLMQAITIKSNGLIGSQSINGALDQYLNTGLHYANQIFMMGSWNNMTFFVMAFFVLLSTYFAAIVATGLIIVAKCGAIVLLALSPLFITLAIFDATKGFFEAYVKSLITFALIPVLVSVILMILFSVSEYIIQFMNQQPKQSFMSIIPFTMMSGIQVYLLMQVYGKASALAGGFTLKSAISTLQGAKDHFQKASHTALGGQVGKQLLGLGGALAAAGVVSSVKTGAKMLKNPQKWRGTL